jgi:hypothetical protein
VIGIIDDPKKKVSIHKSPIVPRGIFYNDCGSADNVAVPIQNLLLFPKIYSWLIPGTVSVE